MDIYDKILKKKELYQFRTFKNLSKLNNTNYIDNEFRKENILFLHPHQSFIGNYINPNTDTDVIFLKHEPGTGKTLSTLFAAKPYIDIYRELYRVNPDIATPSVFIIGFSKPIFIKELLKRPEFGFVSKQELREYNRVRQLAYLGSKLNQDVLKEMDNRFRRRISKKTFGGFYKFFGYKELFNKLLFITDSFIELLESRGNEETPLIDEDLILNGISNGSIKINWELVASFANSFVICDEFHNVYNTLEMNNYGIALHILFILFDMPQKIPNIPKNIMEILERSKLRRLFTSATPINNSPTEIVDFLNLLIPINKLPNKTTIQKSMLFDNKNNIKSTTLNTIKQLSSGYISYFRDNNPKYFPKREIMGDIMKIPNNYYKIKSPYNSKHTTLTGELPYLKFIYCTMSPLHERTYKALQSITIEEQLILDIVYPMPPGKTIIQNNEEYSDIVNMSEETTNDIIDIDDVAETDTPIYSEMKLYDNTPKSTLNSIGIFSAKDLAHINIASQQWKDKIGIQLIDGIVSGSILEYKNIKTYSGKYYNMLTYIFENLKHDMGKIIISHQRVKYGILQIAEILRRNGIIDETTSPAGNTLCSVCGKVYDNHTGHEFMATRFIILHGGIDKLTIERSLDKFKSREDPNGYTYRIALGSEMINEGVDFNSIQNIYVVSMPDNISTLLQIIGRGIRTNSQLLLPSNKQTVRVYLFVYHLPELTYEERKYVDKMADYLVIQKIERVLNENAIDSIINRNTIFPVEQKHADLGTLYFEPVYKVYDKQLMTPRKNTMLFNAVYSSQEIEKIIYVIKRLFTEQSPVWTYDDLLKYVRAPPFDVYINSAVFSEDNFLIALYYLTHNNVDTYSVISKTIKSYVERLIDIYDKNIIINNTEYKIIYKHPYFIRVPIENDNITKSHINMGVNYTDIEPTLYIDYDVWSRPIDNKITTEFNITKKLKTSHISYDNLKLKFFMQYQHAPISTSLEIYDLDFHIRLIEDSIRYIFNILTNPNMPFSVMHDFYFKLLEFYDKLNMIVFASDYMRLPSGELYKGFVSDSGGKLETLSYYPSIPKYSNMMSVYNPVVNILVKSLIKQTVKFSADSINKFINRKPAGNIGKPTLDDINITLQLSKNKKKIRKVPGNILPIGHFINQEYDSVSYPKLYNPDNDIDVYPFVKGPLFTTNKELLLDTKTTENSIIIGYFERFGIETKFKLRPSIQNIKRHGDIRMIEKGTLCFTKNKSELQKIMKQLNISNIGNIKSACNLIRDELIRREIEERTKKTNVRWFYLCFEEQPKLT